MMKPLPRPLSNLALILALTFSNSALAVSSELAETEVTPGAEQVTELQDPEVVARVNGEALYVEDVSSLLSKIHEEVRPEDRTDFDLDQMLFRLVNDTLIAQEAKALGLADDERIDRKLQAWRVRLATDRFAREEIYAHLQIEPEEMEQVYSDLFRLVTLRIATRRDRGEAEEMLRELRAGADFEALARERSQDFYAVRGGLARDLPKIDLRTDLGELVFSLEPGELVGPIATRHGWSVLRVESFEQADPELFDQRKWPVRDVLRYRKMDAQRARLLEQLRTEHEVVIRREVYDGIGIETMPDGRLLPKLDDSEAAVAVAGGRVVTASDLGQALTARWDGIVNPDLALDVKPAVLDGLITDALLTAEALRRGYDTTPAVEREVHALETRLLVERYFEEVLAAEAEVTREEVESYFSEHREEFRKPPRLYVSQLTVASEEEGHRLAALVRDGADFAWLARQHSTDRLRDKGGVVGWLPANQGLPGFLTELAAARAGDLFGPKGDGEDWRLLQVGAVEEQGLYSLEEVSGNVRARLEDRKIFELIDNLVQTLRERSEILVNEEAVAALRIIGAPKPKDADDAMPGHGGR